MNYTFFKRTFDILFALFLILVLSPLLIILTFLVLIISGKPIIYKQTRVGRREKPFTIYKFRSMVNKAEEYEKKGVNRNSLITPIGRFIRPLHLDELPQLFNIVKGDMSFIGFRPMKIPEYMGFIKNDPFGKKIFSIRPGLSGLESVISYIDKEHQIKIIDKYHINEFDKKHHHDPVRRTNLYYVYKRSPILDLKIIFWTLYLEFEHLFLKLKGKE
jgi:lipopolysaccharide/colanic/teichoic acid biosynthesis glycosyltransferase